MPTKLETAPKTAGPSSERISCAIPAVNGESILASEVDVCPNPRIAPWSVSSPRDREVIPTRRNGLIPDKSIRDNPASSMVGDKQSPTRDNYKQFQSRDMDLVEELKLTS